MVELHSPRRRHCEPKLRRRKNCSLVPWWSDNVFEQLDYIKYTWPNRFYAPCLKNNCEYRAQTCLTLTMFVLAWGRRENCLDCEGDPSSVCSAQRGGRDCADEVKVEIALETVGLSSALLPWHHCGKKPTVHNSLMSTIMAQLEKGV